MNYRILFLSVGFTSLIAHGALAGESLSFTDKDNQVKSLAGPSLTPAEANAKLNDLPYEPPQQPAVVGPSLKTQAQAPAPQPPAPITQAKINNNVPGPGVPTVLPQKKGFDQISTLVASHKKKKKTKSSHAMANRRRVYIARARVSGVKNSGRRIASIKVASSKVTTGKTRN